MPFLKPGLISNQADPIRPIQFLTEQRTPWNSEEEKMNNKMNNKNKNRAEQNRTKQKRLKRRGWLTARSRACTRGVVLVPALHLLA